MNLRRKLLVLYAVSLPLTCHAQSQEARTATREQYAACFDESDRIALRLASLTKKNEEHQAFARKFQAADDRLNEQAKKHPPRTKDEIASYNRAIDTRNAATREFNARAKQLQQEQDMLNATIFKHNEGCGSLLISAEVKAEVEEGRRSKKVAQ